MSKKVEDLFDEVDEYEYEYEYEERSKLPIIFGGVGILSVAAIGFFLFNRPTEQKVDTNNQSQNKVVIQEKKKKITNLNSEKTAELSVKPVKTPDYLRKPYSSITEEEVKEMMKSNETNFIGRFSQSHPQKSEGFTSDKSKEFDKDGLPNMYYVSITGEDINKQISNIIYRIIDPTYGGWTAFQRPNTRELPYIYEAIYQDIATVEYREQMGKEDFQGLIFIDKDQNNYNGKFNEAKGNQARFVGKLLNGSLTHENEDTIRLKMDVEYKENEETTFVTKSYDIVLKKEDGQFKIFGGTVNDKV